MAQGQRPDFEIFVSQKNGDTNYYTKVGAGWNVAKGGISIEFVPGIAVSGKAVMFPPKEENDR